MISQVAALAFGDGSIGFYLFQAFTALILFLAANTSYNAFPRLAAILARDGYMPRQFSFRGDRLAFTSGIVILSRRRDRPARRLRGQHDRADPALLRRRVRVVHDQPGRDGPPLAARAVVGLALAARRQRLRLRADARSSPSS